MTLKTVFAKDGQDLILETNFLLIADRWQTETCE